MTSSAIDITRGVRVTFTYVDSLSRFTMPGLQRVLTQLDNLVLIGELQAVEASMIPTYNSAHLRIQEGVTWEPQRRHESQVVGISYNSPLVIEIAMTSTAVAMAINRIHALLLSSIRRTSELRTTLEAEKTKRTLMLYVRDAFLHSEPPGQDSEEEKVLDSFSLAPEVRTEALDKLKQTIERIATDAIDAAFDIKSIETDPPTLDGPATLPRGKFQ